MKGVICGEEKLDAAFRDIELPEDLVEKAGVARSCWSRVELDDEVLALISTARARRTDVKRIVIRKAVMPGAFLSVIVASAFKNTGRWQTCCSTRSGDYLRRRSTVPAIQGRR